MIQDAMRFIRRLLGKTKRFFLKSSDVFFSKFKIDQDLLKKVIADFDLNSTSDRLKEEYDGVSFKDGENVGYFKHILTYINADKHLPNNPLFVHPRNIAVIDFMIKHVSKEANILEYGFGLGNLLIYLKKIGFKHIFGYDNYSQIKKETVINFLQKFDLGNVALSKNEAINFKNNVAICVAYFWYKLDAQLIKKEAQNLDLEYILVDYSYAPRYIKNFKIVGIYKNLLIVFKRRRPLVVFKDSNGFVRKMIAIYTKLPFQPFGSALRKLYRKICLLYSNRIVFATVNGIKYKLDLRESIDNALYYRGFWEPRVEEIIKLHVKPGMVVIDIGANMGCHALLAAKLAGPSGKVYAFEPIAKMFLKLKKNIAFNNFGNVIAEKIALSDRSENNKWDYFQSSFPVSGGQFSREGTKEQIDFLTLDEYVQRNNVAKIDVIKIDVDGYELKALRGGTESLKKYKPLLIVEFSKFTLESVQDTLEELIDFLESQGYVFYSEVDLSRYPNKKSLIDAVPYNGTINVLCKYEQKN